MGAASNEFFLSIYHDELALVVVDVDDEVNLSCTRLLLLLVEELYWGSHD